ncbi:MAG: DUF3732 domain-containing protein [Deltaproteobacteria bacterium]|nr:DUF3732 domain-containing protein [Deltaproteobacteria bacterium]
MKAHIRKIILFSEKGDKREVDLKEGLNIITGDSKTGKSALIEIVDYCLFSSRSGIPKGKIDKFASLFSIVLEVEDKLLVIGRPGSNTANWRKAYFAIETDKKFLDDFSIRYFEQHQLTALKEVQSDVEKHLGLAVTDTTEDIDEFRKTGKATMRSFASLIFQHQNLIANKHALFYRFDDFQKRQRTLNEIPILMNWVDGKYYSLIREKEEKEKQLKAEKRLKRKIEQNKDVLKNKLLNLIENYYALLGLEIDRDLSFAELKAKGQNLPLMPDTAYSSTGLQDRINSLKKQRQLKQDRLYEVEKEINELEEIENIAINYVSKVKEISSTNAIEADLQNNQCPICHNPVKSFNETLTLVKESRSSLRDELLKTGTYKEDNSELLQNLRKERDESKRDIRSLTASINQLEDQDKELKQRRPLRDQSMILKGTIETTIKQVLDENTLARDTIDLKDLQIQVNDLKEKLDGYDLRTKFSKADAFLYSRMNEICGKLDFEKELKPENLHFRLEDFNFFHLKDHNKIYLSEMGSGANWLACHLSLFLALLHLICKESKSCIPSILFIDQPSQVYFPKEFQKTDDNEEEYDENIIQVQNIFNTLVETIREIEEDCQFTPQIVVMEHADNLELKGANFNSFVRKRWATNGEKLI